MKIELVDISLADYNIIDTVVDLETLSIKIYCSQFYYLPQEKLLGKARFL